MDTRVSKRLAMGALFIGAALLGAPAQSATAPEARLEAAYEVVNDFTGIPEQGIPPSILRDAYGVAVIPGMTKMGFIVGGRFGRGIMVLRQDDDSWSNPAFIEMGGGSVGWQIGAQRTDLVLVFRNQRSVDQIAKGSFTLGGDASIAAGPVGRSSAAATDHRFKAEIFSYSRNRGVFAGVSLDGSWVGMDKGANEAYYNNGMSPEQILSARNMPAPLAASEFSGLLAKIAPRIDATPMSRTAEARAPATAEKPATEVKTFAIAPIEESFESTDSTGDETVF